MTVVELDTINALDYLLWLPPFATSISADQAAPTLPCNRISAGFWHPNSERRVHPSHLPTSCITAPDAHAPVLFLNTPSKRTQPRHLLHRHSSCQYRSADRRRSWIQHAAPLAKSTGRKLQEPAVWTASGPPTRCLLLRHVRNWSSTRDRCCTCLPLLCC